MEILSIFLAMIIAFLGLPVGFLLAKIAKNELKPGKRYFQWLQSILLILAVLSVLNLLNINMLAFAVIAVVISTIIVRYNPRAIISYFILLCLLLVSKKHDNLFMAVSSFIFLYGLPTGAIMISKGFVKYMEDEIENPINPGYRAKVIRKIIVILWVIMLEIISIPSFFMKNKSCAEYHLKFICSICPSSRKEHRDVHGKSTCWWEYNWRRGNYSIPKHFGIVNWIGQYSYFGTNLKKFRNLK